MNSNYEKRPLIQFKNKHSKHIGWDEIGIAINNKIKLIQKDKIAVAVEFYPGVYESKITEALKSLLDYDHFIQTKDLLKSEKEIVDLTIADVTEDRIFGFITRLTIQDFFNAQKKKEAENTLKVQKGITIICGTGASELDVDVDITIYADMARWEIQQRMRRKEVGNLGRNNIDEEISKKYKTAYFVDWRVADRIKRNSMENWDFYLDTNNADVPKMVDGPSIRDAFKISTKQPFRVVPFFDPGPWGGQWMKEVCDLNRSEINYAWCFDCVPEENSVLYNFDGTIIESPAINIVFSNPKSLLGEDVYARFGAEFPIRFDFLDTMGGGNLSLQVHPLTEYIRKEFGMHYTQDESYYLLDVGDSAVVYLGLKNGIDKDEMANDLKSAQQNGNSFNAEDYVSKFEVKKHDHILIPAGTIHCSGKDSMVLEISATPYIFTFKLWDWDRLGLDGKPRPINIERGLKNIQWERNEDWAAKELVNNIQILHEEDGIKEERTGLHETEFIETRRHWFNKKVTHHTNGGVNVLNLVEGREAIVESPENSFEPYIVHYAETFIIPADVGTYTIRPHGESIGKECATIKAYVRT